MIQNFTAVFDNVVENKEKNCVNNQNFGASNRENELKTEAAMLGKHVSAPRLESMKLCAARELAESELVPLSAESTRNVL